MLRRFDEVEVERDVNSSQVVWVPDDVLDSGWYSGNHEWFDTRGTTWSQAQEALQSEERLLEQLGLLDDSWDEDSELYEEVTLERFESLMGLDIGVASTVSALSAAGCLPFTSCNGGCLGGHHQENYPLVAFYARSQWIPELLEAATEAQVGLVNGDQNSLVVYTGDIHRMLAYGRTLIARRSEFEKLLSVRREH